MSLRRNLLIGVLALAGFLFAYPAKAQNPVSLTVTATPSPLSLNNALLFTITVSNITSSDVLQNVFVTNVFGPAVFNGATNSPNHGGPPPALVGGNMVIFQINQLQALGVGNVATLRLSVTPQNAGPFINRISSTAQNNTNVVTIDSSTQVNAPTTDLAVGMTNQASGVLVGDSTVIGLSVTNRGPIAASGVVLSSTLPNSFKLLSISPASSHTYTNGNLVLNLGALTNGATRRFSVTVQPTNAVTNFNLVASVSASGFQDTNTANNTVTNVMSVGDILSTNLTVTEVSQRFNPQTGLREMVVELANQGPDVPAARVIVSGLTNGTRLYNGVGTHNGAAYALYNNPLAIDASVNLLLEFYVFDRGTLTNLALSAIGVPAINLTAPTNSGVVITNPVMSSDGFLIEFTATPGKTYTIVYASDSTFSNALTAQPSIVAPANRVQWIDNGPPKTVSHPSVTPTRAYRVFQSQ